MLQGYVNPGFQEVKIHRFEITGCDLIMDKTQKGKNSGAADPNAAAAMPTKKFKVCQYCGGVFHPRSMAKHVARIHKAEVLPNLNLSFLDATLDASMGDLWSLGAANMTSTPQHQPAAFLETTGGQLPPAKPATAVDKAREGASGVTEAPAFPPLGSGNVKCEGTRKVSEITEQMRETVELIVDQRGTQRYTNERIRAICETKLPMLNQFEQELVRATVTITAQKVAALAHYAAAYRSNDQVGEYRKTLEQLSTLTRGPTLSNDPLLERLLDARMRQRGDVSSVGEVKPRVQPEPGKKGIPVPQRSKSPDDTAYVRVSKPTTRTEIETVLPKPRMILAPRKSVSATFGESSSDGEESVSLLASSQIPAGQRQRTHGLVEVGATEEDANLKLLRAAAIELTTSGKEASPNYRSRSPYSSSGESVRSGASNLPRQGEQDREGQEKDIVEQAMLEAGVLEGQNVLSEETDDTREESPSPVF